MNSRHTDAGIWWVTAFSVLVALAFSFTLAGWDLSQTVDLNFSDTFLVVKTGPALVIFAICFFILYSLLVILASQLPGGPQTYLCSIAILWLALHIFSRQVGAWMPSSLENFPPAFYQHRQAGHRIPVTWYTDRMSNALELLKAYLMLTMLFMAFKRGQKQIKI